MARAYGFIGAFAIGTGLLGCASAGMSPAEELADWMAHHQTRPTDASLDGPLGDRNNPVRANGAAGQRDYLHRLRCPDDSSPSFERISAAGIGPYGKMIDAYRVQCEGQPEQVIHMDLYHCEEETEAVDGFTITPRVIDIPNRGCG